jgi:outer membrane protein OmpA-like peptidoglycan-associated protein
MNPHTVLSRAVSAIVMGAAFGVAACGSNSQVPPRTLVDARAEFQRAKDGPATALDPTDVHEADVALQRAEQAWRNSPGDPTTTDLAIVAQRRARIAETEASTIQSQQETQTARAELRTMDEARLQTAEGQLGQTRQALGQTQMQLQEQEATSTQQAQRLQDMQVKLDHARETIAKIAAVKDDERGMVVTLQDEVLFKTGKWDLKPGARAKLDQIAEALKGNEERIVVYGFTDNAGTVDANIDLSFRRASAVCDYLASKGVPPDLIAAEGKGPANPLSDNGSVEGRAMNRRVEIVVRPKAK